MKQQRTLAIIGGMSWESTLTYYKLINEGVRESLGGQHSADILMHSLDFAHIEALQAQGDWEAMAQVMEDSAKRLKLAGAEGLLIATNTMHKLADNVIKASGLPLIHIADATVSAIQAKGLNKIALLGTKFTMGDASDNATHFYKSRFIEAGIDVIVPDDTQQNVVHSIIYDELCQGVINAKSKTAFIQVIRSLSEQGAQGVILGCTEIGLLINSNDSHIPVFDTAHIHANAGVRFLLS
ncbi:aspartate/glutamate racemase family protein [Psychrobacter sp. FDAARGOS_221]|uniref:aspartate/glutamate racemase family protein n=1 Tax=Psychrobacter sp. FDAARGOS_221 TaxID=1975705 RepID=UPI000BB56019|nr:aspartate/glutamate racemase family protein [Psychrobacter sp. FDAARGOS_221]PNK59613.1 aspartate/glutamate racemase family protein [Psychrobacter sp. FDAARGOS_221]